VKKGCANAVEGFYGLKSGCAELVARLLAKYCYIFPQDEQVIHYFLTYTYLPGIQGKPKSKKPYQHGCILSQLRTQFFARNSHYCLGRYTDRFATSNNPTDPRKEVPGPMLALVATAVSNSFKLFYLIVDIYLGICCSETMGVRRACRGRLYARDVQGRLRRPHPHAATNSREEGRWQRVPRPHDEVVQNGHVSILHSHPLLLLLRYFSSSSSVALSATVKSGIEFIDFDDDDDDDTT
jgi:hypothetical protein